jgi:hypothetical protein
MWRMPLRADIVGDVASSARHSGADPIGNTDPASAGRSEPKTGHKPKKKREPSVINADLAVVLGHLRDVRDELKKVSDASPAAQGLVEELDDITRRLAGEVQEPPPPPTKPPSRTELLRSAASSLWAAIKLSDS